MPDFITSGGGPISPAGFPRCGPARDSARIVSGGRGVPLLTPLQSLKVPYSHSPYNYHSYFKHRLCNIIIPVDDNIRTQNNTGRMTGIHMATSPHKLGKELQHNCPPLSLRQVIHPHWGAEEK